jgi:hypothetical protein
VRAFGSILAEGEATTAADNEVQAVNTAGR